MAIHTVVGGQFGSEAKGHTAYQLLNLADQIGRRVAAVRVGGPNAGHTIVLPNGETVALRCLPVGAAIPGCICVISAGSEIDPVVLHHEVKLLEANGYDIKSRLLIDQYATVITQDHIAQEVGSDLNARTGSTAKGIGRARADRIMRTAPIVRDSEDFKMFDTGDTSRFLRKLADPLRYTIVIEGTQGYGLGLHTRFYPQTTSGDCRSVDLLAQSGIHPYLASVHSWVVFRPYPIRVAGNSGPLIAETTWERLQTMNPAIPVELTTVTKKRRRVGGWDGALAREAFIANGAPHPNTHAVLMFADYVMPELAGRSGLMDEIGELPTVDVITLLEDDINAPFDILGTSPSTILYDQAILEIL